MGDAVVMQRMTVGMVTMGPSGNSYIHAHEHYTLHDKTHVSSGNSVGVAIPQPRVAGEARYPGYAPPTNLATL